MNNDNNSNNPNLHHKPTKEELLANIEKSQQDLAALDAAPQDQPQDPPTPPDPTPSQDQALPKDEGGSPDSSVTTLEPQDFPPQDEPKKDDVAPQDDEAWKKRYAESTKEAQKLLENNKEIEKVITQADSVAEPTEDELKAEYQDWDDLDPTTQKLAKEAFINKRFRLQIEQVTERQKAIKNLEDYAKHPVTLNHYPQLEGKQKEFVEFASDSTRISTDFPTLTKAFLYELQSQKDKRPSHKGEQMFETGVGGPNDAPKPPSDKISMAEADVLRKTDYKKFREYLVAGKIESVG